MNIDTLDIDVAVCDRALTERMEGPMGAEEDDTDTHRYVVVVNDEEQYSIWIEGRELPAGWRADGVAGTKAACLAHIDSVWTDMRPASLRRAMAERVTAAAG
jgi:MbtH protein